ncbi:LacI family DNA-binding transcriptional regulator [Asticcacaulis sp. 201]|uniref:LacI family DNA-binding transcriptional regulator n=1 Tax=Asticcacaulis sp. 201 TaxID=3028787 RepID=UPI002915FF0D|nr:LacI family DNA-binding transcriptional regulator [Asticcacaulis sp. 201]MDV6332057.1 LacI family DNA-binding transcriptional regulator [Asticcacaulis sp. 201]
MQKETAPPVTLQQIALQAGVSVSTVSRALARHPAISEETRELVLRLAKESNYDIKRRQGIDHSQIIVVMAVPAVSTQMAEPFQLRLLGGIGSAMRERHIDFSISHRVPRDADGVAELMSAHPTGGFIFLGQSQYHEALNKFNKQGRALAVWGAQLEDQNYCSVGTDNFFGGQRATSHLLRLGRRRIAFLGACDVAEIEQRLAGYKSALTNHGVEMDASLIQHTKLVYDSGFEAVNDLLDRGVKFDGIVSASDMLAIGAMRALSMHGIVVPDDVSVVGYDDIDVASFSSPALTTIRQDVLKAGHLLVTKAMRQLAGHNSPSERLQTELIVRGSCGG